MRTNAKDICNRRILNEFALEHSIFITTIREDWIVPCLGLEHYSHAGHQNHIDLVAGPGPEYLLFFLEQLPCHWGPGRFLTRLFDGEKTGNWAFTHHWIVRFLFEAKDNGYKLPKDLIWYYRLKHQYDESTGTLQKMLWKRK